MTDLLFVFIAIFTLVYGSIQLSGQAPEMRTVPAMEWGMEIAAQPTEPSALPAKLRF